MRKDLTSYALVFFGLIATAQAADPPGTPSAAVVMAGRTAASSTADHSKFKELDRDFKSGPEVTRACLQCHTEAARQVMRTKHWTWEFLNPGTGQRLGKKNVINNFCTAVPSNYEFCTACHVGYGWKDANFDFSSEQNVDCLVCHDTTGTYRKLPGFAGHPVYQDTEFPPKSGKIVKAVDLKKVAQHVGKSSRKTCGSCHFFGGGGDGVKHGDLDSSLTQPGRHLDVHMAKDGLNFSCGTCHLTSGHDVPGSRYAPTAMPKGRIIRGQKETGNPASCESCHGVEPHAMQRLNTHARKIACQTCHIPEYARGGIPTKTLWDWSTAGRLDKEGKPFKVKDSTGREAYDSKKGDFRWETHVIPEYIWFNGTVNYTLRETRLDPTQVVKINSFEGSPMDGRSKIWPIKVFRGKQPYDVGHNQLVVFHTWGKDDAALWTNFNWERAIEWGMREIGAQYSGKFAFVATEMSWPITHMVAPKEDALGCAQCHAPATGVGRLDQVPGVYMPGRSANRTLDTFGWGLSALALLGVLVHGGLRILTARKREGDTA
ncbi:MAG: tetrathionate reductase family octaheme c-type cytochrome [Thiobacillaceae bacterium]|nr:tetrathionate reductase family octaheme c-type cytochrome [Thiobacillaceae bacterium]